MNRLCSPNMWVGLACVFGAVGAILVAIGMVADVPLLRTIGLFMIAPIVIAGVGIVIVVIPLLVIANRKHNQRNSKD